MQDRRVPTVLPNGDIWYGVVMDRERDDNVSIAEVEKGNAFRDELDKEEGQQLYHCPFCDLQFGDKEGFKIHVRQNHALAIASDAEQQRMAVELQAATQEEASALSPAEE